jgi:hypothetical protein
MFRAGRPGLDEVHESEAIVEIARLVVADIAPQEEILVPALARAHLPGATPQRSRRGSTDKLLGFGVESAVELVTPVVLAAAAEVVRYLASESARLIGLDRLRRRLPRQDRPSGHQREPSVGEGAGHGNQNSVEESPAEDAPQLELSPEQRRQLREVIQGACSRAGAAPERASLVADAVLGVLGEGQ